MPDQKASTRHASMGGWSEIRLLLLPLAKKVLESLKKNPSLTVTKRFWVTTSSYRFRRLIGICRALCGGHALPDTLLSVSLAAGVLLQLYAYMVPPFLLDLSTSDSRSKGQRTRYNPHNGHRLHRRSATA